MTEQDIIPATTLAIAEQNERFRTTWGADFTVPGQIALTRGVADLPQAAIAIIMQRVRQFSDFTEDNDPYGDHTFGAFEFESADETYSIFWKIDLSDLNPCSVVSEASILTLAENISAYGLTQNIAGFAEENGIGVVVGGRRYRALALLQDDPRFQPVSVKMAPDLEIAQREALHPADEIRDFGAMEKRGATVADIAMAYGATEAHVYRRLALGNLPAPVIDALRNGEISLSNAAAFTISDDDKLTLEVLENVRGQGESDRCIKKMLKPDAVKDSDHRAVFVGLEAYKAAGGRTGSDLFAEEVLIDDPAILDALFGKKLEEAAATL